MFFVVLLYTLFASVFVIGKTGLEYTTPLFLVGTRMFLAGLILLAYQMFFKSGGLNIQKKHLWRFILLAFFNIYITNVCEFWGLRYLTSAKTCFIYSLSPFVAAILSYLILGELMTKKRWQGLIVGFLGFIPVMITSSATEELTGQLFVFSWAELAVVTAACTSVYGWILLRQLVSENNYSPLAANGISMTLGGAMALVHSLCSETWDPVPVTQFVPFLECAFALLIISNLICYNLYGWLLKRYYLHLYVFCRLHNTAVYRSFWLVFS